MGENLLFLQKDGGTEKARRGGPYIAMPYHQTQTEGTVCVNRGMKVSVLQVDIYKTILGSDASDDVPLCQHLERKLVKGPIPDS